MSNILKTTLATLFVFGLFLILNAQEKVCPRNAVNCAYGCGLHIDNDADGYCDYSAFTPDVKEKLRKRADSLAAASIQSTTDTLRQTSDTLQTAATITDFIPQEEESSAGNEENGFSEAEEDEFLPMDEDEFVPLEESEIVENVEEDNSKPYDLILVSGITFFLYFLTFFLYRGKVISKVTHRRIWNGLLLLTFLVSCIFGFILVIQINYNIWWNAFRTLLYWHVEIGIAMTLISIFHILWHLRYFRNIFRKAASKRN